MTTISLEGLDKAEVLAALFNGSKPQGLGFLNYGKSAMTKEEAQRILDSGQTYFDYLQGRVMKVDLSGDELNPWLYDRDNGFGAAAKVVDALQKTGDTNPEEVERWHLENTRVSAEDMFGRLDERTIVEKDAQSVTITLGVDPTMAELLRPIVQGLLGLALSVEEVVEGVAEELRISRQQATRVVEENAFDVQQRAWYMVKQSPESTEAQKIAGQFVTVAEIHRDKTASVFTVDVFTSRTGVAVRVPLSDLTNR